MANPSRRSQRTSEPEWHRKVRKAKNLLVEVEMANEAPDIDRISIQKQDLIQWLKDHPHDF